MIKIEKVLLFAIVLVLLVGVVSATETPQEDQSYTNDDTVVSDISTVSQDNKDTIKFEEKNLMDDNPIKIGESKTRSIEKKTKDTNLKQDGIIEVHNYTELENAVNNARSTGVDTTIRLLSGSYNNTERITWDTDGMVLTIDGNGQTINGHQQQVFYIKNGASMILKNIIITNATSSNGGAIHNYMGTLTVNNSTFNNNQATDEGGAIYNYDGTLNITQSTLTNNTANFGGAIYNYGTLTVTDSIFTNNNANNRGGAIYNDYGLLTITNSQFLNNQAFGGKGGAIYDSGNILTNITSCNFINNTALNGAAIYAGGGGLNLTDDTFNQNTATSNKETIDLYGYMNGLFEGNTYESTDIALNEIKLTIKDDQDTFQQDEDIILNYTIQLTNPMYYGDFETGINDITLYINGEKNKTTQYENITLKGLKAGKYEIYYTTCNQKSNTVTFKVIGDSQITTPEESYEYYPGINNKIPLIITDPSGEKGTINITVKEDNEYKQLFTYYNIGDGYELPTESLASTLENLYNPLSDSYTINIIYSSDYANPSSTEFTLNIIRQRNTTITYDIINNTEGNVQINITVLDTVYQTPIKDANIKITGDINTDTTTGVLTNTTITPGDYTITVQYPETSDYKESKITINFNVEIDKDKKIEELEELVENLNNTINELNNTVQEQNNTITDLNNTVKEQNNTITDLQEQIAELKAPKNTTITLDKIVDAKYNENVTISGALVNEDSIGLFNQIITLTIGETEVNVTTKSGIIEYETLFKELGDKTVTARFAGTDKYIKSEANTTFTIEKQDVIITFDEIADTAFNDNVTITGKFTQANGKAISNSNVNVYINGKQYKARTDKTGSFTLSAQVKAAGTNNVTLSYGGNTYYNSFETNTTFNADKQDLLITYDAIADIAYGDNVTITGKFTEANGRAVFNSNVNVYINGKQYKARTDKDGFFTLSVQVKAIGTCNVTLSYGGNDKYNSFETSTTFNVEKQDIIITYDPIKDTIYGDNVTISGKFTDINVKAIIKSNVNVYINGKQYKAKTDTAGVFTLSVATTLVGTNNVTLSYGENDYYTGYETNTTFNVIAKEE